MNEVELTIEGQAPEPGGLRLVATLALAGMLSGLLLAGAFQITKPIIEANKIRELRKGVIKVVPGSTIVSRMALRDGTIVPITDEEKTDDPVIYGGYDDAGTFQGYAIANEGAGFQDLIQVLYGFDPARRRVIGMHILSSRETPGLGDKIFKDMDFVANFNDLSIDPTIVVVKDGRDQPNEVDSITGATISTKAVVKIINQGNAFWLEHLPELGSEPPAPPAPPAHQPEAAPENPGEQTVEKGGNS